MGPISEKQLLHSAMAELRKLLPERFELAEKAPEPGKVGFGTDAIWTLSEQNSGYTEILVEAKTRFTPRDAERVLGGLPDVIRYSLRNLPILVVAPWLSRRARELLEERDINYLDLTGNVWFSIERPVIVFRMQGAESDPQPADRPPARLKGSRVNRLVRLLVDVAPPYRTTDLARCSELSQGYVSRVLESLDDQALITRDRRGVVVDVDWAELLISRSESYDLLRSNTSALYTAARGAAPLYEELAADSDRFGAFVVTGSYAAAAVEPVAPPTQLAVYTRDPERFREAAGLYDASTGASVVLLTPADPSQVDRARMVRGVPHVGLSQLALDCLSGNGRLPEEGYALLGWMRRTSEWRLPELPGSPR